MAFFFVPRARLPGCAHHCCPGVRSQIVRSPPLNFYCQPLAIIQTYFHYMRYPKFAKSPDCLCSRIVVHKKKKNSVFYIRLALITWQCSCRYCYLEGSSPYFIILLYLQSCHFNNTFSASLIIFSSCVSLLA